MRNSGVYFIKAGDFVKIGYSAHVTSRMANLQSSCPLPLELIGLLPPTAHLEGNLHKQFESLHLHGEWFKLTSEILEFLNTSQCYIKTGHALPISNYSAKPVSGHGKNGRPRVKISPEAVEHLRNRGYSWRRVARSLGIGFGTARRLSLLRSKSDSGPIVGTSETQRDRILGILRERGSEGVANLELTCVCLRYGARIYELRKRGWEIETRKESEDRFRFVLLGRSTEFSTLSTNFPKDMGTQ